MNRRPGFLVYGLLSAFGMGWIIGGGRGLSPAPARSGRRG